MNVFSVNTKVNGLLSQTEKYQMMSEFYCNNLSFSNRSLKGLGCKSQSDTDFTQNITCHMIKHQCHAVFTISSNETFLLKIQLYNHLYLIP